MEIVLLAIVAAVSSSTGVNGRDPLSVIDFG